MGELGLGVLMFVIAALAIGWELAEVRRRARERELLSRLRRP